MTATISHTRLRVLFAFFTGASLLLSGRLAYWQTIGRADLLSRATDQVRSDLAVAAQRGVIRDRSGAILATTVELRSLYAIPSQMKDAQGNDARSAAAAALAPILGEKADVLRAGFAYLVAFNVGLLVEWLSRKPGIELLSPLVTRGLKKNGNDDEEKTNKTTMERLNQFVAFPGVLANVTGGAAMSVPLHWNADGLPIGSHFLGQLGDEAKLVS